ncbi:MAG TPA: DNA mismatch repair endonuclease MutL [Candidatus Paceibacterota bacterium]|nr:DNA mismatch repair endonuclease MutL [Verrucomicrobiota bacterium]HSA09410.1 DNA mismatch repair endonuclease MutL [Candidatus Paceibacterota bacterium]
MNRIRLLPEQVANQIAAGEVIERPASVVKELVENALDAQAARVTVEIQAGGRSLVRVADDGLGMSRDDALLCLERHATSKIRRAEDLAAVATMGFRGEALPSIASVSRFTLTTRERAGDSPEGTQIVISGGKIVEVKAAGTAPGTTVEVRQLFFNLPARRKFLRTEETESAHIQHYLTLAALAYPEVAFNFQRDGRLVWQLPPVKTSSDAASRLGALRERLRALYGSEQKLLTVDYSTELTSLEEFEAEPSPPSTLNPQPATVVRLWGFIGAPGVSRSTREDQHLFVNRRPVENRGLNFALLEGYHTALMKGRYPVACLFLEIDPAGVDVNIHPAKREVKFHREAEVRRLVAQAIRQTLLAFHTGPAESAGPKAAAQVPPAASISPAAVPLAPPVEQSALPNFPAALTPGPAQPPQPAPQQPALRMGFSPTPAPALPPAVSPAPAPAGPVPLLAVPLRLVGVIGRLYVVLESDRGLVLLDQHAAHERILFEQMLARLERHDQAPSQRLLLPETVELSARDASFLREQLPVLTRLGVGLSDFGERTFLLDALPPFVKVPDARRFVVELVDELKAAGRDLNTLRLGEHTVAKTVCRHAVKANDPLAGRELENLVEDLRHCAMPYTCPHGRPTLIEMSFRELEKKFGRTQ